MDHSEQISLLIKTWRKLAIEYGLKGIHFIGSSNGLSSTSADILNMGFDAVYVVRNQLPFYGHNKWSFQRIYTSFIKRIFGGRYVLNKVNFEKKYKLLTPEETREENRYPVLLAGYDRSPRAGRKAQILYNFTPETWRKNVKYTL